MGAAVSSVKAKAAKLFGTRQLAIGVPGGAEVMAHATRRDAAQNPEHVFMAPDIKNAYNALDRVEAIKDLCEFDPFIAGVAASLYTVPTRYLYTQDTGEERGRVHDVTGGHTGLPTGHVGFLCVVHKKCNVDS